MPDVARFTLHLTNAEGKAASEPDCYVGFVRTDQTTAAEADNLVYPPDKSFLLQAFPQEQNLICSIEPTLYQDVKSRFFTPTSGNDQEVEATLVRLPDKWFPVFQPLAQLPAARFAPFQQVVANSTQVDIKNGPVLGKLDTAFDNLTGTQQILAKMALLNLYAVLSDETDPDGNHWWPFVQQIVRIDQERFCAEADPKLWDIVQNILSDLGRFDGYFTELSPNLHLVNIPERYQRTEDLITVKKRYDQGNVQFTMCKATTNGRDVVLLDCDMDEHANIIEHTTDLFI